jgi:kynurenine formamidase
VRAIATSTADVVLVTTESRDLAHKPDVLLTMDSEPAAEIIDLSQEIYEGMPVYAGHLQTKVWQHHTFADTAPNFDSGFAFQSFGLQLCDHGPTHVDALAHLDPSPTAPTIDQMPLSTFCGPGTALDVSGLDSGEYCSGERLDEALACSEAPLHEGDVLLLRTGAADRFGGTDDYPLRYPGFDQSAAAWLRAHQIKIFGVDSPSPDAPGDRTYPIHLFCRGEGITHYENLANLGSVVGRRFDFFGLPLRIRGGTGSPVRAVALLRK